MDREMSEIELYELAGGHVAFLSHKSPIKEGSNEDSALLLPIDPERGIIAVADGLGGQAAGAEASQIAIGTLEAAIGHALQTSGDIRAGILNAFEDGHRRIRSLGIGAGTTLVVAEIDSGLLRTYHAGDSQAILFGADGSCKRQTVPHSPIGYALASGVLDENEAFEHEDRHYVCNVLGGEIMHIGMSSILEVMAGDSLLVASDGLFDSVRIAEIVEILREGSVLEAGRSLCELALGRMLATEGEPVGKPDDLTIALFRMEQ